jgi:hypothetical protein
MDINMSPTSKKIRELLDIKKIPTGVPGWMLMKVQQAINDGRIGKPPYPVTSGASALRYLQDLYGTSWTDHFGMLKCDGFEVLVTEPYAEKVTKEMIDQLSAVTSVLGAAFLFSAISSHYPGRTIRIYIAENSKIATAIRNEEFVNRNAARSIIGRPRNGRDDSLLAQD